MTADKITSRITQETTLKRLMIIISLTVLIAVIGAIFVLQPSTFLPDQSYMLAEKLQNRTPENEIKKFFDTANSGTQTDLEKYWTTNPQIKSDEDRNEAYTVYKGLLMRDFIDAKYSSYEIKSIEWWAPGCCAAPARKLDSNSKANYARILVSMKKDNQSKEYIYDVYNTTPEWYDEFNVGQEKLRNWKIYEIYTAGDEPFINFTPQNATELPSE